MISNIEYARVERLRRKIWDRYAISGDTKYSKLLKRIDSIVIQSERELYSSKLHIKEIPYPSYKQNNSLDEWNKSDRRRRAVYLLKLLEESIKQTVAEYEKNLRSIRYHVITGHSIRQFVGSKISKITFSSKIATFFSNLLNNIVSKYKKYKNRSRAIKLLKGN